MLALLHQHTGAEDHAYSPVCPSATGNCNNRQPSTSPGVTMIVLIEGFPGKGKSHEAVQKIAEKLFDEPPSSSSTTTEDIAQQPTKNQNKIQE
jgi:hypothetical protein